MPDTDNKIIEDEVRRRVGRQVARKDEEILELRKTVEEQQDQLLRQHAAIQRMDGEALTFATIVKLHNFPNPIFFKEKEEIIVVDESSPHFQKSGLIVKNQSEDSGDSSIVDEDGHITVGLHDGGVESFAIGLEGKDTAQVRLVSGNDGTYAVINERGIPWEVRGVPDMKVAEGDPVKIISKTKAIMGRGHDLLSGPICRVMAITDKGIEVQHRGELHLVFNPRKITLEEGDRVSCDDGLVTVQEKLSPDPRQRYKLKTELNVTWDDIGGLEHAKKELRDALELPLIRPDLFSHYNVKPLNGILLYGPPGCGKTMIVRVCAWAMAQLHNKEVTDTAYRYVKSPEILDKYIGNTEAEIRTLFQNGRRHFLKHGYKQCLVFDEAEAILPKRGTRRSSDIADTMVPMFLGEMDGADPKDTEANPVVFLLSNRADIIDPAITRPGRVSKHIKISRPTQISSMEILRIHTSKIPFRDNNRDEILALTCASIFSKSRVLYRVNNEHDFTFGDCVNGAILANVAEIAKMNALYRDLQAGKITGAVMDDFKDAVEKSQAQLAGVNHDFDLADFAETRGIDPKCMESTRHYGSAG